MLFTQEYVLPFVVHPPGVPASSVHYQLSPWSEVYCMNDRITNKQGRSLALPSSRDQFVESVPEKQHLPHKTSIYPINYLIGLMIVSPRSMVANHNPSEHVVLTRSNNKPNLLNFTIIGLDDTMVPISSKVLTSQPCPLDDTQVYQWSKVVRDVQ